MCKQRCTDATGRLATLKSAQLQQLVSPGAVYGYDLEVRVGLERYLHHRQRTEIQDALAEQGIALSTGQISALAARFIRHLEALHQERAPLLREALAADGGYPLHIDATGEDGRGTLFVAYSGWKKWVLASRKLSTERADLILPCLRQVVNDFGIPCAVMRDLGRAVIKASNDLASELDVDLVILSCHLHFLRDIGKDLLEESHNQLRELFRRTGLRAELRALSRDLGRKLGTQLADLRPDIAQWSQSGTDHTLPEGPAGRATVRALAQWALDYAQDGEYGSFPFDRPYLDFYHRCLKIRRAIDAFLRTPPTDKTVRRALERLARITEPVISQVPFSATAARLSRRATLFEELRTALRLTPRSETAHDGPTERGAAKDAVEKSVAELSDIQQALDSLTLSLRQRRPDRGPAKDQRKAIDLILKHIERHGESLWGHVINSVSGQDPRIRIVARTNNCLEGFHRSMKHGERRRSGRKVLTQDFESLPAGAALVYNLNQPDYVQLLCGSIEELPRAFAELDAEQRKKRSVGSASCDPKLPADKDLVASSLPRVDQPVVRAKDFQRRIETAAKSRAPHRRCG